MRALTIKARARIKGMWLTDMQAYYVQCLMEGATDSASKEGGPHWARWLEALGKVRAADAISRLGGGRVEDPGGW